MTDKEIIKALECCIVHGDIDVCKKCPYVVKDDSCVKELKQDSLELIISQKAEINKLKSLCVTKDVIISNQEAKIEALKMDNQQLETDSFNVNMNNERLLTEVEKLKATNKKMFDEWLILCDKTEKHYEDLYKDAKDSISAEAIKNFAEKLKLVIINTPSKFSPEKGTFAYLSGSAHRQNEILNHIDKLVREMGR